jgi:predicted DNA-binding transcriptional regulator AlpA
MIGFATLDQLFSTLGFSKCTLWRWLRRNAAPSAQLIGRTWFLDARAVADLQRVADARRVVAKPKS